MKIEDYELKADVAINQLENSGEKQEDGFKKAVKCSYNSAVNLFNDEYYGVAIRESLLCADMAVKLFLWKKHMANYSDYHNLPMHRILNWFPDETMHDLISDLKKMHELYEEYGDYMEMVEEYTENLYSRDKGFLDVDNNNVENIKKAARDVIILLDKCLVRLLRFE
ncbi:hypothetical protein COV16_02815 [Candidatus Woesearchaeota archaeon CG10_big_fil_rev_8_21_14_0_10_34_8]|nr:MAG: hypothetical protein COV16_02815 [Candidatus Woesearchaeota archaeon CG10_big_fil_rev_8_21_14_0_10_34_8]